MYQNKVIQGHNFNIGDVVYDSRIGKFGIVTHVNILVYRDNRVRIIYNTQFGGQNISIDEQLLSKEPHQWTTQCF